MSISGPQPRADELEANTGRLARVVGGPLHVKLARLNFPKAVQTVKLREAIKKHDLLPKP